MTAPIASPLGLGAEHTHLRASRGRAGAGRLGAALLVVIVTVALGALADALPAGSSSSGWRLALEALSACAAAAVAMLFFARARLGRQASDMIAVVALSLLVIGGAMAAAALLSIPVIGSPDFRWFVLVPRSVGALALGAAAWAPHWRVAHPVRAAGIALGSQLAFVVFLVILLGEVPGLRAELGSDMNGQTLGKALVQGVAAGGLFSASLGFFLQGTDRRHELRTWMGVGALAGAGGFGLYVVAPMAHLGDVHPGDVMRVLFYGSLLTASVREVRTDFRAAMEVELIAARRRLAHDMHDGVAQELAYVLRQCARLGRIVSGEQAQLVDEIAAAARRGLDDSREGIALLRRPIDEALSTSLARLVEELAHRYEMDVHLAVDQVAADVPTHDALLRVATEALANAAAHGQARRVHVELRAGPPIRLRITDDGVGFDPTRVRPTMRSGYGLEAMREGVAKVGGRVEVISDRVMGTTIEVTAPC